MTILRRSILFDTLFIKAFQVIDAIFDRYKNKIVQLKIILI
jgi:hypothetical protein